jgi:hypothetical protein
MPALAPQPNILRVRLDFAAGSDSLITTTTHWVWSGTAPTAAMCTTAATDSTTAGIAQFPAVMDIDTLFLGTTVEDLTTSTGAFGSNATSTAGVRAGAILPASAAVLVNLGIARRYRGGKPRLYFPWGTGADLADAQSWAAGAVTNFTFAFQSWLNSLHGVVIAGTTIVAPCSISQYHGFTLVTNPITGRGRNVSTPRAVAIAPDVVTTFAVNPKVGSQRRRYQR